MMLSTRVFVYAVCVAAASLVGCSSTAVGPSTFASYSQTDLIVGTGDVAAAGESVTVDYTGWLYDASAADHKGVRFDTTTGASPFTFTLGAGQVIQGWEQGLIGMKVGGVRRLVIPPSLGYGANRNGPIPPYSTLVFDVTLNSVNVTAATTSRTR